MTSMDLKILLPFKVFAEIAGASRIVAESREGSFGLLPQRLDCVAALAPGILVYQTTAKGEAYVAIDEGVLVKSGANVLVSVRNAFAGTDLAQLRATVEREFVHLDQQEEDTRAVLAKMEGDLMRRMAAFSHV